MGEFKNKPIRNSLGLVIVALAILLVGLSIFKVFGLFGHTILIENPFVKYIDINCDVGEGVGNEKYLFPYISSCNVACGGHAGDASSMQQIAGLAKKYNVKLGAHPSYPDKENFGRASMDISSEDLIRSIQTQISSLAFVLEQQNIPLHHIKAHGTLYNQIASNAALAACFLEAIQAYKETVLLYVPPVSEIEKIAVARSFSIRYEVFADRNYNDDLSLVGRKHPDALIQSPEAVLQHIVQMVKMQKVRTLTAKNVKILAETFCIHSDTPSAIEIVMYLSQQLPNYNIQIEK